MYGRFIFFQKKNVILREVKCVYKYHIRKESFRFGRIKDSLTVAARL